MRILSKPLVLFKYWLLLSLPFSFGSFHKDEDAHEDDAENQVNRINEDFEYDLK